MRRTAHLFLPLALVVATALALPNKSGKKEVWKAPRIVKRLDDAGKKEALREQGGHYRSGLPEAPKNEVAAHILDYMDTLSEKGRKAAVGWKPAKFVPSVDVADHEAGWTSTGVTNGAIVWGGTVEKKGDGNNTAIVLEQKQSYHLQNWTDISMPGEVEPTKAVNLAAAAEKARVDKFRHFQTNEQPVDFDKIDYDQVGATIPASAMPPHDALVDSMLRGRGWPPRDEPKLKNFHFEGDSK